jgi:hypothetical protein
MNGKEKNNDFKTVYKFKKKSRGVLGLYSFSVTFLERRRGYSPKFWK